MKKFILSTLVTLGLIGSVGASLVVATGGDSNGQGTVGTYEAKTGTAINPSLVTGLGVSSVSAMAINGNNAYILKENGVANQGTVSVYDITSGALINSSLITGLNWPTGIDIGNNSIFVNNQNPNQISQYNLSNGRLVNSAFISGGPFYDLKISGSKLFASIWRASGSIAVYDLHTGNLINGQLVSGLNYPVSIAIDGNKLFVANFGSGTIGEYNADTGATINANFITGILNPRSIAVVNGSIYVANDLYTESISQFSESNGALINASFVKNLNSPVAIAVVPEPSTITTQPTDVFLTGTNSQTATFSVLATNGVPPYAYQWMKDGVDLTNQTNASLILSNAAANTVGYYSCDVTDQTGTTVTSSNAALNITGVNFNLWQGLVGYYPLQTNPNDLSGYGNDINLSNLNFTNTGSNNFGKYCHFNQTNSYFYQSSGKLNVASSMTLSFWVKALNAENLFPEHTNGKDQYPSHNYVIFPDYYGYSSGLGVAVGTNGVSVVEHGYDYLPAVLTFSNPIGSNWNHIVVLTDNNDAPSLYVNGNFVAKGLQTGRDKYFSFPHDQSIVDRACGSGNFQGGVADVRIYNRALSSNEVASLYALESTPPTGGTNKQTIFFPVIPSKRYGGAPFNLGATASSSLPITYTCSDSNVATISGNTVTIVGAGTASITASQSGNSTYAAAPSATQALTVNKAAQTISFATLPSKTYGDGSFTLSGTASSGLPVTYTSGNTNVATISGNMVTIRGAGAVAITANQVGNPNFNAAVPISRSLTVARANQTINFTPPNSMAFVKNKTFPLSATSTSGGIINFTSSNPSVLSIAGKTATMKAKGTVTVTASALIAPNYNPASTNVTITLQ